MYCQTQGISVEIDAQTERALWFAMLIAGSAILYWVYKKKYPRD